MVEISTDGVATRACGKSSIGRMATAREVGYAVLFLASDESSFLTGADIPIDGGLRFKYPAWRPGDESGVSIGDYVRSIERTEYGELRGKLKGS